MLIICDDIRRTRCKEEKRDSEKGDSHTHACVDDPKLSQISPCLRVRFYNNQDRERERLNGERKLPTWRVNDSEWMRLRRTQILILQLQTRLWISSMWATDREETLHDVALYTTHRWWNEKLASAAESLIKNSIHIISIPSSERALTRLLLVWMKHKCNFTLLSSWCGPTRGSRFLNISASHRWMQTKWSFLFWRFFFFYSRIYSVYIHASLLLASQNFFFSQ